MDTARTDRWAVALLAALLLAVPLLHSPVLADPFEFPREAAVMGAGLVACLLALVPMLRDGFARGVPRHILYAMGGFLACGVLATVLSANRGLSARGLARDAGLLLICWVTARHAGRPAHAVWIMRATLAAAVLVAAGTLVQVAIPGYGLSLGGVSLLPPVPAGATLGDPGLAIQFLLLAAPLGMGAAALSTSYGRLACAAGLGLVAAAVFYAGRPEGWVAGSLIVLVLTATSVYRARRIGRREGGDTVGNPTVAVMVSVVVLLLVVAASRVPGVSAAGQPIAPLPHVGLLAPTTGDPGIDRAAAIRGTSSLLLLHPLGVGPGFWRDAFLEVAWTRVAASPFTLAHQAVHAGNSLLELVAEFGFAGGLLFVALVLMAALPASKVAFGHPGDEGRVALAGLNVLVAGAVVAFFGSPFQETAPALVFWVGLGLSVAAAREATPGDTAGARERGRRHPAVAWAALTVWAALAAGLGLWLAQHREAERLTLMGQGLIEAGDAARAVDVLSSPTIARSPDHLPFALLGNACLKTDKPEAAASALTNTLARSPWFLSAYLGRAAAWEGMGRYDRADADLKAALAIWPDNPATLMSRGRLDARRGRVDQAIADYRLAAEKNPAEAEPWYAMGELHARMGDDDAAIADYNTCARKNPRHPRVNMALGGIYEKKGLYEMSVGYFQRAATVDPTAVDPRLRLANSLHMLQQYCQAVDALEDARDLETDPKRRAIIVGLIDRIQPDCQKSRQRTGG